MSHRFLPLLIIGIAMLDPIGKSCSPKFAAGAEGSESPAKKLKVLVVTGGHGFQPESFFKLFSNNPAISYTSATETNAAEAWDRDDLLDYDVVLLYDFQRELNDAQKGKFLSLFNKGVGLVVLHHALLSYQHWPEYERIAGGKYLLDHETVDGKTWQASTYKGDVDIDVKLVDKDHPDYRRIARFCAARRNLPWRSQHGRHSHSAHDRGSSAGLDAAGEKLPHRWHYRRPRPGARRCQLSKAAGPKHQVGGRRKVVGR